MERAARITATVLTIIALGASLGGVVGTVVDVLQQIGLERIVAGSITAEAVLSTAAETPIAIAGPALALAGALASCALGGHRIAQSVVSALSIAIVATSILIPGGAGYLVGGGYPTLAFAGVGLLSAAFAASALSSMFKANYDTGAEHGAERMAEGAEKSFLADTEHFYNNIAYSEHAGQALVPTTKKLEDALHARNRNDITIGTSGLGKTHHRVEPELLNAMGDFPVPVAPGRARRAEHALEERSVEAAAKKMARTMEPDVIENPKRAGLPLGDGYDFIATDPKGDTMRALGNFQAACGCDLRIFDTVEFKGHGYNPLDSKYIPPHQTDVCEVEALRCAIKPTARYTDDEESEWAEGKTIQLAVEEAGLEELPCALDVGEPRLQVDAEMTYRQKLEACNFDNMGVADADIANAEYLDWKTGEVVNAQGEAWSGRGDWQSVAVLRSIAYKQTRCFFAVTVRNELGRGDAADAVLEIELDRSLALDPESVRVERAGAAAARADATRPGVLRIEIDAIPHNGMPIIEFEADIESFTVPDGVALTKTVECLVANLKHAEAPASNQDPFWEECKRLAFISLTAAAYEWYANEDDRNLNTVARLLNMALPEEGGMDQMSPLGYLMRRWEKGEVFDESGDAGIMSLFGGARKKRDGWRPDEKRVPHARSNSLALHCFHAFTSGAPETVQSVIITCQTAFVSLLAPDVKKMLAKDEMRLTEFGKAGKRQGMYIVTKDTDSPYDFLTALIVYQTIDLLLDKAYHNKGKLDRHVRFSLDEFANIGKIPIMTRAMAVVRSRNMSISLYVQSRSQIEVVYGEKEAQTIINNCTTQMFLGGHDVNTLKEFSETIGDETIYSRITNRSFGGGFTVGPQSISESIQATGRKVRSAAQLRQMENTKMLVFIQGARVIEDTKYPTSQHPYYPYVYSDHPRPIDCGIARCRKPFDPVRYIAGRKLAEASAEAKEKEV